MGKRLEGRVALITGGGGGLGGAAARALSQEGAIVVVTDIAHAAASSVAEAVGGHAHAQDVTDEAQWAAILADVIGKFGKVDVLLNAAGIEGDLAQAGLDTSLAEWRRVLGINLDGTFLGCRTVMPYMLERKSGSIINIASIVSMMGSPSAMAYGASKAAVQQLTQSFALIGAKDGGRVRCNSVHPGLIKTQMTDRIFASFARNSGGTEAEAEQALCAAVPFGQRGTPDDVAAMIVFLASDESRYVTGSEFKVDGGWLITNAG
ncbi:hypothetical protein IP81_04915 [Novosphingobium sp. AAP83]|uniref:glucose 1-dehydrogenase n=1 Tax=Novosphingobium sp. AAP83 TaxID=1523425 RepID=UPI0006B9B904|nr:glucose 1-dehydrogenase [Novosphingobium sp. AAP83]KPF92932.1 hypothetical protein IP81_04915 [Novosphingobium sp. AAP83]